MKTTISVICLLSLISTSMVIINSAAAMDTTGIAFLIVNLLPAMLFFGFHLYIFNKIQTVFSRVCYIVASLSLVIYPMIMYTMWHFDIAEIATKSSTSGLLFVTVPISSILFGIIPVAIALLKRKS